MPSSRFCNVPEETGVTVIFEQETTLGDYQVLYQKRHTERIAADSFIFFNDDIVEISDRQLEELVRSSPLMQEKTKISLKRSKSFTSVNFNMRKV